jgi:transposase
MTLQKHYYTYSFVSLQTGEYVGWNSEVASSEDEAIDQAVARYLDNADETTDYRIDLSSFVKQTDEEMNALVNYTS